MILAAAAYIAGLFFALFFTIPAILFGILAGTGAYFIGRYCGMKNTDFIVPAVFFAFAAVYMSLYTAVRYEPVISYAGESGSFCGTVIDVRPGPGGKAQYTLNGRIDGGRRTKLTVYTDDLDAEYGDTINIDSCKFDVPEGDYFYDPRDRLRSEGIYLTVSEVSDISLKRNDSHRLRKGLIRFRERMCREFTAEMGDTEGEFLSGIVFGQTSGIDRDTKTALSRCGLAHMLAVSGLHVSIAAFVLMQLLGKLRIKKSIAFVILNLFLITLVLMADSPVSAIRASIMLDMMYAAGLFRRQNDTFTSLSAAVLMICIVQPYTILSSGFWLSVTGTFGIGVAAPYFTKNMPSDGFRWQLLASLITMLCTMLCIMPLSMMFFDETSLISPLTNIFLAPLFIFALVTGIIYVFTYGTVDLLAPTKYVIDIILEVADHVAGIRFTHFSASEQLVRLAFLLALSVALVQLILNKRKTTAYAAALACSIMFLSSALYRYSRYDDFRVAVLGKGSNAAVVITYRGHTDVIDLSGHYKSPTYVRKYLMQNGIDETEMLVLTKKVHSQYSAYKSEFSTIDVDKLCSAEDISFYSSEPYEKFSDEGFFCDCGSYTISYSAGELSVVYGENEMTILPAGSSKSGGLRIYYGNISEKTEIFNEDDAVYLDSRHSEGMNNFEVELSPDGTNSIRRLQCHTLI